MSSCKITGTQYKSSSCSVHATPASSSKSPCSVMGWYVHQHVFGHKWRIYMILNLQMSISEWVLVYELKMINSWCTTWGNVLLSYGPHFLSTTLLISILRHYQKGWVPLHCAKFDHHELFWAESINICVKYQPLTSLGSYAPTLHHCLCQSCLLPWLTAFVHLNHAPPPLLAPLLPLEV
jgi:hypothetical protein